MRCYICDKETHLTVLKAWLMCRNINIRTQEDIQNAWVEILSANHEAYADRYDEVSVSPLEDVKCPLTIEDWEATPPQDKPSKAERYSALREYMYQCSEGDYYERPGYYKSRWCLDDMLEEYVRAEFSEATGWGLA